MKQINYAECDTAAPYDNQRQQSTLLPLHLSAISMVKATQSHFGDLCFAFDLLTVGRDSDMMKTLNFVCVQTTDKIGAMGISKHGWIAVINLHNLLQRYSFGYDKYWMKKQFWKWKRFNQIFDEKRSVYCMNAFSIKFYWNEAKIGLKVCKR